MNEIPFRTFTGRILDLKNPNPHLIDPIDIAHNLARICRYTGSVKHHYSVAEHCVLVAKWLKETGEDEVMQMRGLLHDAAEAYIGDVHGPSKVYLRSVTTAFDEIEKGVEAAIGERFNIDITPMHPHVHTADMVLLLCEKRDLLKDDSAWSILKDIPEWHEKIIPWDYKTARNAWLDMFYELHLGNKSV